MPYHIGKFGDGFRLILDSNPSHFFSKHPMTKENVIKQMKAIEINGGLINDIPENKVILTKKSFEYPQRIQTIVDFFKFPLLHEVKKSEIRVFGSYNLKIQKFYADIDTTNVVYIDANFEDTQKIVKKLFQRITQKIENKEGWFFTDAKAGAYDDGEAIHWTAKEILKGKRNGKVKDFNGHLGEETLLNAVKHKGLLKIDMVVPYYNRYIEATVVYLIKCRDGPFNYNPDWLKFKRVATSLIEDTKKQMSKHKNFKVLKRSFAMLRYTNRNDLIKLLVPIISSNISLLSSIASYLDTILLLLALKKPLNKNFVGAELQSFKDTLSNIQDIEFDEEKVIQKLDYISRDIKDEDTEGAIKDLDELIKYIQMINNREIDEYFQSRNTSFETFVSDVFMELNELSDKYPNKLIVNI